jgi:hypothetical protein
MFGALFRFAKLLLLGLLMAGVALACGAFESCNGPTGDTCDCPEIGPRSTNFGQNSVKVQGGTCIDRPCESTNSVRLDILRPGQLSSQQAQSLQSKGQLYSNVLDIRPDGHSWDPAIEVQFEIQPPAPHDNFLLTIFQWRDAQQDWHAAGTAEARNKGDTRAFGQISHTSLFALVDREAQLQEPPEPPEEEPPRADFDAEPRQGGCEFRVQFINLSERAEAFFWEFGDGGTSGDPEPVHVYSTPGEGQYFYTVILSVGGPGGEDVAVKEDFILAQCIQ